MFLSSRQVFRSGIFILFLCLLVSSTGYSAVVKMSRSKICHPEYSQYYKRTKNYTPYPDLPSCLNAGGRLPKKLSTHTNVSTPRKSANSVNTQKRPYYNTSKYKREYFGRGWADLDHDCQNSRMEALIAQSTAPVRFKTNRECRVVSGRWISPFTNSVIHDPSKIDIDHIVPLKWAWIHGADRWTQSKRKQFANDQVNLWSVEASLNRQKGAKGPSQWLPPKNQCEYALRFVRIVKKYRLETSSTLSRARQRACGQ